RGRILGARCRHNLCIGHGLVCRDGCLYPELEDRKKCDGSYQGREAPGRMARKRVLETDVHGQYRCVRDLFGIVMHDLVIIGAGPSGLACAIEAQKQSLSAVVLEKGCITNSIFHFPAQMVFFTTPELLEIGSLPLVSEREKPTRNEALKYYR